MVALCLATFVPLFAGCTAPIATGVKVGDHGEISVVSCGTWIEGIEVSDADSGHHVWSAHAIRSANGSIRGRGSVVIGQVPTGWTENAPLRLTPRPRTWRFVIDAVHDQRIVASDSALRSGRVFRPGTNRYESAAHFSDRTCSGSPPALVTVGLIAIILGSVAYAIRSEVSRR
jgi:hypothetical protein